MSLFTVENQGFNTYLVYQFQDDDVIDSLSFGMISNNNIKGIAPVLFTQIDDKKYLKYNISAKIPVKQYFEGSVSRKRLLNVFLGICSAIISSEEYMVDADTFVLELDNIYVDVSTNEVLLICLPFANRKNALNLHMFFKNIIFCTQFDQTENCDYVAKIINYLNSVSVFSVADFKKLVAELNASNSSVDKKINDTPSIHIRDNPVQTSVNTAAPQIKPVVQNQQKPREVVNNVNQNEGNPANQNIIRPVLQQQMYQPVVNTPQTSEVNNGTSGGKKMSFLNLMMHYNKENAAIYKEQKNNAKNEKRKRENVPADSGVKQMKNTKAVPPSNFAIPGNNTNNQFAVPGQSVLNQNQTVQNQYQVNNKRSTDSKEYNSSNANIGNNRVQNSYGEFYTPISKSNNSINGNQDNFKSANFGETTVLDKSSYGETTVLNNAANNPEVKALPYLIRQKNNERIVIDKPRFRIGKERSYVDYFIGDNSAISRSHADIIIRNGEYFIVDMNSTNHTYVDDVMINSGTEVRLQSGSKITLANEKFDFKLI